MQDSHAADRAGPPPEGLEALYREFSPFVHRLALNLGLSSEDAEDAVHDVFIRIHDDLRGFRGDSSVKTWIYRMSVHHCLNRIRRRRLERLLPWSFVRRRGPLENRAPAEESRILNLLGRLSPKLRTAVVLKDLEELSYEEIAQALEVSPGTVMSRVARGREVLRKIFSKSTEENE